MTAVIEPEVVAPPAFAPANGKSVMEQLAEAPEAVREKYIASLTPEELAHALTDWTLWGRPKQFAPPGKWQVWMNLGGRGVGKTRTGAEWAHDQAEKMPGSRGFLLGATSADVRDVMIEGESGLLETQKPHNRVRYQPSRRKVTWQNGTVAKVFMGEEPRRLRGPQHHWGWIDEWVAFKYPRDSFDQAMFGLRLKPLTKWPVEVRRAFRPRAHITSTPKPILELVELLKNAPVCHDLRDAPAGSAILEQFVRTVVTISTSHENRGNLDEAWYESTIKAYEGTALYDQEILARILTDVQGALWKMETIEACRIKLDPSTMQAPVLPDMNRMIIAVDPAVTSGKHANETGIVACGRARIAGIQHGYVLGDYSGRYTPLQWAEKAIWAYKTHKADRIVAEKNQGGELVKSNIHSVDASIPVKLVTATRGKVPRAEPVAGKYEQRQIHHVGTYAAMESQMTTWTPDTGLDSPDRLDALVWGMTELLLAGQGAFVAEE